MNEIKIVFYAPSEFEIANEIKCRTSSDIIDLLEETLPITRAVGAVKASDNFYDYCKQHVEGIEVEKADDEFYEVEDYEELKYLYKRTIEKIFSQSDIYLCNLDSLTLRQPDGTIILLPRWKRLDGIKIYAEEPFLENDDNNLLHFSQVIDFLLQNPFFKVEQIFKDFSYKNEVKNDSNLAQIFIKSQNKNLFLLGGDKLNFHIEIKLYANIVYEIHLNDDLTLYQKTQGETKIFLKEFAEILPNFLFGRISDKSLFNRSLAMHDIKLHNDILYSLGRNLAWYNLLSPRCYREFFTKKELLKIPTYEVEELANDKIGLSNYPDPYGLRSYGSRDYVFKSLQYLRDILKDEEH